MEKGQDKRTNTLHTDNVFTRKEYIEREAAKKVICDYCSCVQLCSRNENDCWAIEALQAIPAADVVPVVRGKWITVKHPLYECSVCGAVYQDVGYGFNYCPNCGALMDKDGDGDV